MYPKDKAYQMKKSLIKHCNGQFENWNSQNVGETGLLIANKGKNQDNTSQYNSDVQYGEISLLSFFEMKFKTVLTNSFLSWIKNCLHLKEIFTIFNLNEK